MGFKQYPNDNNTIISFVVLQHLVQTPLFPPLLSIYLYSVFKGWHQLVT